MKVEIYGFYVYVCYGDDIMSLVIYNHLDDTHSERMNNDGPYKFSFNKKA